MKQLYHLYAFFVLIIAGSFISCEKDIDFKGKVSNHKIVLNSLLTPDSVVSVQLTQSRFVIGEMAPYNLIADAEVSLFVNGVFKETLLYAENGNYKGSYYPQPDDEIKIEVAHNNFDKLFAQTVIPGNPDIAVTDSILTIYKEERDYPDLPNSVLKNTFYNMQIQLALTDVANEENYYYIKGKIYNLNQNTGQLLEWPLSIELSEVLKKNKFDNEDFFQEIFGDDNNEVDNLFHDRFIDGNDIVFDFSFQGLIDSHVVTNGEEWDNEGRNKYTTGYMIEIGEISKDFYQYMISAQKALNAEDAGFLAEPVMIHSNVENGIGILGSYNTYRFTTEVESYSPVFD